ncbi:FimB/Mfa2 family fimbrial subunit [Prevotella copri]|uniref:FimB/Mfa2 family fimbrial subunit n=1 Tax=Segatella copri TaxID=165179 RepID=A0AAW5IVP2_9BACT|nr:fimbrial protein [Segatella copri]MCP9552041.1 FimB/Mfa2 family fimbrial subunit [Segatella copri]MCP9572744.1 FimB/Mfa2 family fimbrial subunit [Segatella copri]MCP9575909.1 FimB/Mfa2 family fimbrial subunit [Segatella copri]MCP9579160.1 FimB/Mfa2 family fimbrial subunit [Segatella copri]MCP9581801.1 FimB/Mfa2 family fimbrial subunit [Segatella copri]
MNKIKTIMALLVLTMLATFTACSPDDSSMSDNSDGGSKNGYTIHLKLSTSAAGSIGQAAPHSRALTLEWESGSDVENMKSWFVVLTQGGNVVQTIEKTQVDAQYAKEDEVTLENVAPGTYQVYSFANIDKTQLGKLTNGSAVDFKNMKYKMNGNGFDATISGIPMSNEQTLTVKQDGTTDKNKLWVVRMLAKVTLRFKNPSATALEIKEITLSDVTSNPSSTINTDGNIMLLPKYSDASSDADKGEVKCIPNLVRQAATENYTYELSSPKTIPASTDTYKPENEISFYVNESAAGNTSKYFIINLKTSAGIKRYALFQDWTTIARNDHHILPISLDDYKLKFDVQSFTAIGLYPSITDYGTTLSYTCYYPEEEFHIQPKVVKASDDKLVSGTIDYANVKWNLIQEDGMADAAAATANAHNVFKVLPSWNSTTGYFEGIFNDDKADKQSALYQVTVPVLGETGKSLIYKILFTKDLSSFAARKYTRQSYNFRTKQ